MSLAKSHKTLVVGVLLNVTFYPWNFTIRMPEAEKAGAILEFV